MIHKNYAKVTISTPRLMLVPITENFAQDIFTHFDKEVTRFMFPAPAEVVAQLKKAKLFLFRLCEKS